MFITDTFIVKNTLQFTGFMTVIFYKILQLNIVRLGAVAGCQIIPTKNIAYA
jgi:hypothetical protein